MSVLEKLKPLVTADQRSLNAWRDHADVIKDIVRLFKFEPLDLVTRVHIEERVFAKFADTVVISWETHGKRNWMIARGAIFGGHTVHFLI